MQKVIIGIHGLRNKPPRPLLTEWWRNSIEEGFRALKKPVPEFEFEMAHWSGFMHPEPQDPSITDRQHPLFLAEPYTPGTFFGPREMGSLSSRIVRDIWKQFLKWTVGKPGFRKKIGFSDLILETMFKELDIYYHGELAGEDGVRKPAGDLIRSELVSLLRKHQGRDIMIAAHSMGCVIAYDVLMFNTPDIPIQSLVTLGSPQGFPIVLKMARAALNLPDSSYIMLPTPENIRQWLNLADTEDVTALNYNLRTFFGENTTGVRPFDEIVFNNYECEGKPNPHKAYGYFRTADFTRAVEDFVSR